MRQRRINEDEAADTLESPDETVLGDHGAAIAIQHHPLLNQRDLTNITVNIGQNGTSETTPISS